MFKLGKFVVQVVFIEETDGEVTGEVVSDPVTVYGLKGLKDLEDQVNAKLSELNGNDSSHNPQ